MNAFVSLSRYNLLIIYESVTLSRESHSATVKIDRLSRLYPIHEPLGSSDGCKFISFYLFVAEFTYIIKI